MTPKRPTIADVAREAGVSRMTVSRVLNNRPDVSAATAARIWEIIEQLGYRPSSLARGLSSRRTNTLGLVVPDISNPFFSDVAGGAEEIAYAQGFNLFLCNTNEEVEREAAVLQSLEEQQVAGLILCSPRLDEDQLTPFLSRFQSVAVVNRQLSDQTMITVEVDNFESGQTAVKHLLAAGHLRIGMLAGPANSRSSQQRIMGYKVAMATAERLFQPDWIRPCQPTAAAAEEKARQLLTEHPQITALFCYNDLVAVGAVKAAAQLGRKIPHDLAIVGYDDIALAELLSPALTTVRVPRRQLGSTAMRLLLDDINGRPPEKTTIVLQTELIVRGST